MKSIVLLTILIFSLPTLASSLEEIKLKLHNPRFETELSARLCQEAGDVPAASPLPSKSAFYMCAAKEEILLARVCALASRVLIQELNSLYPQIKFSQVVTRQAWMNRYFHVFIVAPSFFEDGEDLIIDATYLQFLVKDTNLTSLQEALPRIFVGRYSQLLKLHQEWGENFPQRYLNTREWSSI